MWPAGHQLLTCLNLITFYVHRGGVVLGQAPPMMSRELSWTWLDSAVSTTSLPLVINKCTVWYCRRTILVNWSQSHVSIIFYTRIILVWQCIVFYAQYTLDYFGFPRWKQLTFVPISLVMAPKMVVLLHTVNKVKDGCCHDLFVYIAQSTYMSYLRLIDPCCSVICIILEDCWNHTIWSKQW